MSPIRPWRSASGNSTSCGNSREEVESDREKRERGGKRCGMDAGEWVPSAAGAFFRKAALSGDAEIFPPKCPTLRVPPAGRGGGLLCGKGDAVYRGEIRAFRRNHAFPWKDFGSSEESLRVVEESRFFESDLVHLLCPHAFVRTPVSTAFVRNSSRSVRSLALLILPIVFVQAEAAHCFHVFMKKQNMYII